METDRTRILAALNYYIDRCKWDDEPDELRQFEILRDKIEATPGSRVNFRRAAR